MPPLFKINTTLSRSQNADPDDTLRTKQVLFDLGYYEPLKTNNRNTSFTPYPDTPLFKGIEAFQKDHGLKRDGIMKPTGETAETLNNILMQQNASNSNACPPRQQERTEKICIPFTNICWTNKKCVPQPIGGRRG